MKNATEIDNQLLLYITLIRTHVMRYLYHRQRAKYHPLRFIGTKWRANIILHADIQFNLHKHTLGAIILCTRVSFVALDVIFIIPTE